LVDIDRLVQRVSNRSDILRTERSLVIKQTHWLVDREPFLLPLRQRLPL
jgi:hypothetical protein